MKHKARHVPGTVHLKPHAYEPEALYLHHSPPLSHGFPSQLPSPTCLPGPNPAPPAHPSPSLPAPNHRLASLPLHTSPRFQ